MVYRSSNPSMHHTKRSLKINTTFKFMFLFYHFHQSNKNSLNKIRPVQSSVPLISFVLVQNKISVESN